MYVHGKVPLWPSNTFSSTKNQSKASLDVINSNPQKHQVILISFTGRQVETGCQATNRDRGPLEVNLNFQRNPIKMQALRRQTLAGHRLCNTASRKKEGIFSPRRWGKWGRAAVAGIKSVETCSLRWNKDSLFISSACFPGVILPFFSWGSRKGKIRPQEHLQLNCRLSSTETKQLCCLLLWKEETVNLQNISFYDPRYLRADVLCLFNCMYSM